MIDVGAHNEIVNSINNISDRLVGLKAVLRNSPHRADLIAYDFYAVQEQVNKLSYELLKLYQTRDSQ